MNPERILGALVRDALMGGSGMGRHRRHVRRGGGGSLLGPGMKGMLGMGALGVAIAAFDHFAKQQKAGAQSFTGAPPVTPAPGGAGTVATSPAAARGATASPPLPPLPPLPPPPPTSAGKEQEALLMIQAMIAAANADYELDAEERERIVRTMEESGLDQTEKGVLLAELEKPLDLATLAAKATTPALRRDVYLASEMAISADTKAEQNYLARLAKQLQLGDEEVNALRKILADASNAP
ncbi:MAG TPA: DUF533 domain-containing protein [Thermoanaerobaculia bacterium]|nr:DUF533 domain-containing protein [Thermoanaerobaculia bacterium]